MGVEPIPQTEPSLMASNTRSRIPKDSERYLQTLLGKPD